MTLAGDPPEVNYGYDECGNCHAELDNGKHICMSNFTVPSSEPIMMSICRKDVWFDIILQPGDVIEFNATRIGKKCIQLGEVLI